MRRTLFPYSIDHFDLREKIADRNLGIEADANFDAEDVAHTLVQVQRRLGVLNTEDASSIEYRLRQIEAALGITATPPTLELPTAVANYALQWQAGRVLFATATDIVVPLKYPVANIVALNAYGIQLGANWDVGITCDGYNIYLTLPLTGLNLYIDWEVQGDIEIEMTPRLIEGTLVGVTTAGQVVNMSPAWASIHDFVVFWTSDDGYGAEVEVGVSRTETAVTFTPAATCDITYQILQVSQ